MKYKISFYEDKNGKSETLDFIDNLRSKAQKVKMQEYNINKSYFIWSSLSNME